jgi:low affinity Fe/Cu permease
MVPHEKHRHKSSEAFHRFASWTSTQLGHPWAFVSAVVVVIAWACSGPIFHFSENWRLVINTGTTIITFLMVFIIQSTQNRDAKAIHLKLDELIRSSQARNVFANLEDATDEELAGFQRDFEVLRRRSTRGDTSSETPETLERK